MENKKIDYKKAACYLLPVAIFAGILFAYIHDLLREKLNIIINPVVLGVVCGGVIGLVFVLLAKAKKI